MAVSIMNGNILHRTQLMDRQQAERFAGMIGANSRFAGAEVVESTRTTREDRYFVSYAPASEAAQQRMLDEERAEREARARAEEFAFVWDGTLGAYRCRSERSGRCYTVTLDRCDCPDFQHRGAVVKVCKHTCALLSALEDGLVGEEEALEMAEAEPCEACGKATTERVTAHTEDGPAALALCEACADAAEQDAREAMLPSRAVTREEQRRRDQDLFNALFADEYQDWLK